MLQTKLRFLRTEPLDAGLGFSVPVLNDATTAACSSRSQVRGLYGESSIGSSEPLAGVRVSREAPTLDAVASATKNGEGRLSVIRSTNDRIKKRSLKRALRRAERDGQAAYQGRAIVKWTPPYEHTQPRPQVLPWTTKRDRIKIVQWNGGGFSQELRLEWYAWLKRDPDIGIFIMIETHWDFSNDFQSEGWLLVHSGTKSQKGAGVLVGIRADLADRGTIKWNEIYPGRLLHVRCYLGPQQYDILALYQYALARGTAEQQADLMVKRQRVWKKMDQALASFPFRSNLILAGDFNLVLAPLAEVAGCGIKPGGDQDWLKSERAEVTGILQTRRFVALNIVGEAGSHISPSQWRISD